MRVALIIALLACASGVVHAEDRAQRPFRRGRVAGRRPTRRREPDAAVDRAIPLAVSLPIGLGIGAAVLPLSPVYAAIALGVTQAPGSRVLLGRFASAVGGALGLRRARPAEEDITVRTFARALNARLPNIVDELDQVPVFLVVDESGKPLKIAVGEDSSSNLTFAYLEFSDAQGLSRGLRTPDGEPVEGIKVFGTSLGSVVREYLERRDTNGTDEMLIMPSSIEVRTAQELIAKLGTSNTLVPNSVPIYQVEGLPADDADAGAEAGGGGAAADGEGSSAQGTAAAQPPPVLSFFRFSDMQARVEAVKSRDPVAMPQLKVRLMRLHEVAALAGSERLPGKPRFIPSTSAVTALASMRASGSGGPPPGGGARERSEA
ncbi:hypothetical protein KFE25_006345 [Diacronema lutheri]|uniref:Uncharacterized protein n=2 Tax=Diacronema lutheri TaxID=2081491 RepID=A0A8J5XXT9_DIALT|nr:hypothetical protein KFE25_006345 [Diacronema lutheri]